jgi:hypothetical protein
VQSGGQSLRPSIVSGGRRTEVVLATIAMIVRATTTVVGHLTSNIVVGSVAACVLIDKGLLAADLGMAHWKKLVQKLVYIDGDGDELFLQFWH